MSEIVSRALNQDSLRLGQEVHLQGFSEGRDGGESHKNRREGPMSYTVIRALEAAVQMNNFSRQARSEP